MGQFAFITFTSILFLVDPIAVVPAYLAFVRTESPERRKATARSACVAAAVTLLVFASAGDFILKMFGVTLISWMLLRVGDRVFSKLGGSGIRVATRIMGLLLAAVAVQFVIGGAQQAGIILAAMPAIH